MLGRGESVGNALINHPKIDDGLDHRRHRHRQEGAAGRRQVGEAHASGTRRQGPGHRLSTTPTSTPVVNGLRAFGYYNAGQDCTAACRIYAGRQVYEKLVADLTVGRLHHPATTTPTTPKTRSAR